MKLSIVVPVYRVAATLKRCVASIVEQGCDNYELILIDDGSPDDCPLICDELATANPRIMVVHQMNGGLSAARNTGLERATGDFVTFVDSDDYVAPHTFVPLLHELEQNSDIDILEYPVSWHHGAADEQLIDFGCNTFTNMNDYWLRARAYEHSYACNKIYRKSLFQDVRFPVGRVFEDVATLPQLLERAKKIVTVRMGLYCYCMNQDGITCSASGNELAMLLESHLQLMAKHADWLHDARYYMNVLNIQIDVYELTHQPPLLPHVFVWPWKRGLSIIARIKATVLCIVGVKGICLLNKLIHRVVGSPL